MGALLHAEPKPRACLRLFACDGNEAEKVLFFAYLLGAPPGLPTRWLFPFVQKQIFSYLVGHPPHYIGLWNVGNWLEGKEEEEVVELASIATERVIWQEIAMKVIEGIADEVEGVVLEAEVEEIEHATIATKRGTLQENAQKGIVAVTDKQRAQSQNPPPFYEFCQLDICN